MKKQWKKAVSIGCAACMLASTMPVTGFNLVAEAQGIETQSDEAATSGTWGTCEWNLDEDGVLTISGGVAESLGSNGAPWGNKNSFCQQIKEIKITGDVSFKENDISLKGLFKGLVNIEKIEGLNKLDTSHVTNMSQMFAECKLPQIDVSNFDTSQVTDMSGMFQYCKNLEEIDVSNFNTSQVIDMNYMFSFCDALTKLDVSNFETSQVTDMTGMFAGCKLARIDLSNFNTSQVTDMGDMFYECSNLTELDLGNFDTSQVMSMSGMFKECNNLTELNIKNFDTSQVTSMSGMFKECNNLTELNIKNFDTSQVTYMGYMFYGCSKLTKLDLSNFDTSRVTNMCSMFSGCYKLIELDLSNFNTENVSDMMWMFSNCRSLIKLNLSNFSISKGTNIYEMFSKDNLTDITIPKILDENGKFYDILEEGMALGQWKDKTENISYNYRPDKLTEKHEYLFEKMTPVSGTWGDCEWILKDGILTINGGTAKSTNVFPFISDKVLVRPIDIQKVEIKGKIVFDEEEVSLEDLFSGCSKLTEIEGLDKIDMSKVVNINRMFYDCNLLRKLDMNGWDMSNVKKCSNIFLLCKFDFIVMPLAFESEGTRIDFESQLLEGYLIIGGDASKGLSLREGSWSDVTADIDYDGIPDTLRNGHTYINRTTYLAQREDAATNIIVKKEDGSLFDSDIELNVSDVTTNEDYAKYAVVANELGNINCLFDIALEKDGEAVQPDGKILVSIPLPDDMSEEAKVYSIAEDGTATDMNAIFEEGYLTFTTDHFSVYAVVEDRAVVGDVNGDGIFNMADAALVRRYVANLNVTIDTSAADVNKDGKIDMVDYALMRRALANWDVELK